MGVLVYEINLHPVSSMEVCPHHCPCMP